MEYPTYDFYVFFYFSVFLFNFLQWDHTINASIRILLKFFEGLEDNITKKLVGSCISNIIPWIIKTPNPEITRETFNTTF